ncbi:MAG: ABC transporter ATP-binding protein [Peptostreptococcaceae bacterium]|nr:ABC transporter ATP-binding protein [Peptostreptococcaceae bacterium]
MKLLEVKNLKTYFNISSGQVKAVDDVSFDLDYGESLGLVGESGCGKTTSALSIVQLLPKEGKIYGGEILLEGVNLAELNDGEMQKYRWNDISLVFQGAMNALNPVMRIGDQIAEAIVLHQKVSMKEALIKAGDILELVEMPRDRLMNYPHEFSGGMKQRVMIAMALACDPKIIIGDEPTTALDVMVQAQILNLIEKLRKEFNMGFILITHDLSILTETCDKIAIMYAGKIVEIAESEELFKKPVHPYTNKLIGCFPDMNGERKLKEGIEGAPPNMLELPSGCLFAPRCEFASDICHQSMPETVEVGPNHYVACHKWEEMINGQ